MTRSGYSDECETINLWQGAVQRAIKGQRGQAFLQKLAIEMDAMPEKVLIRDELINSEGDCCTIGVVLKARGDDVSNIDPHEPRDVGAVAGIAQAMAAEIEWQNDEWDPNESPQDRWKRMRKWVDSHLVII